MKKFSIIGGLMVLALVIGMAASTFGAGKAEAKVKSAIMFNPDVCFTLTGAVAPEESLADFVTDEGGAAAVTGEDLAAYFGSFNCYALKGYSVLISSGAPGVTVDVHGYEALSVVADLLDGDIDNPDTYADLVDASDAQVGDESYVKTYDDPNFPIFNLEHGLFGVFGIDSAVSLGIPLATINSQTEWVIAFPSNDNPMLFTADEGAWLGSEDEDSFVAVHPFMGDNDSEFIGVDLLYSGCRIHKEDNIGDLDCDDADTDMDLGAAQVEIIQENWSGEVDLDYTVVGHVENMTLTSLKDTIQTGTCADCDIADIEDEIGLPDVSLLLAKVTDDDKTALTGIWVLWTANSDKDVGSGKLDLALPVDVTIKSAAGIAAVNLACGKGAGTFDVHAGVWWPEDVVIPIPGLGTFYLGGPFLVSEMDFDDTSPTDVATITVIGGPKSMTLTVSPTSIECNGTNSAVVTATILNAAGKPVVAGTAVRFDVVALGSANPIVAYTDANGQAKTTITPVGNVTGGVTVIVSVLGCCEACGDNVFDNPVLQQSAVVACTAQALPAPPPVTVAPPNTGDGGYLP
jgi:hypothetical protein